MIMSIMKTEDYMYLYSQLSNDKIPQHIKEKIDKDWDFTEAEEREMLDIIRTDQGLKQITYKGITHLYNYAFNTDCGLSVPSQGNQMMPEDYITYNNFDRMYNKIDSLLIPIGDMFDNKKLFPNDRCWCGSGKKYKKCHGKYFL